MTNQSTYRPGLHRYALAVGVCTWLLLLAGALVTSNDAGLAVPDWPLSYGKLMPPMVGGILYEHGHRLIAASVGLLTILLALWLWQTEPRRWLRRLGLLALGLVILQGLLGGITVLFFLPSAISVAHACLAQLFFSTVVSIALATSPTWHRPVLPLESAISPRLRRLAVLTAAAVFAQLVLGALLRHKVLGVEAHVFGALVVVAAILRVAATIRRHAAAHTALQATAIWLRRFLVLQLILGVAAYWVRLLTRDASQPEPVTVLITVLHVTFGALLLAASVVLTWQVYRACGRTHAFPAPTPLPQRAA